MTNIQIGEDGGFIVPDEFAPSVEQMIREAPSLYGFPVATRAFASKPAIETDYTLADILAAKKEMDALPRPHDAFICLPDVWDALVQKLGKATESTPLGRLAGIPIYRARDMLDAKGIAFTLHQQGKKALILTTEEIDNGQPTEGPAT